MKTAVLTAMILSGLVTFQASSIQAQSDIKSFDFKIGHWSWATKGLTSATDPKIYEGTGSSHVYYINDGQAVIDNHKIDWDNGVKYQAITYRTFDSEAKNFMVIWAQAGTGNTAKITGHWQDDTFVEIETGTDEYGAWTNRLEIFDIEADAHKARLVRTYSSGFALTIIEYSATRVDEDQ